MENFDDIRPYNDSEVNDVIGRLLKNDEFISSVAQFRLPRLSKGLPELVKKQVKKSLTKKLSHIDTIDGVQEIISKYIVKILETTTTGLTESGLSGLSKNTSSLFISNHRDIVMDPALMGYLLHKSVHGTAQVAIGDNLLKKEYISDLMRLNKSFIVKRSVQGREKLLASKQLSQYISYSIDQGNNVWLAQREGRAKNGIDKTDPTILKMLHLANRDSKTKMSLKESIDKLRIVPVSISYEYDPCAELKARELFEIDKNGHFEKDEKSDLTSIATGMNGEKGNVHLYFGTEVICIDSDPVNIANQIDEQIITNYKLYPSNYLAYEKLQIAEPSIGSELKELNVDLKVIEQKRTDFENKYKQIEEELKPYFLRMYANPVINKFQFQSLTVNH
ncbi:MAG: 1-acyl-sn-glycerol-3-phosphate acyltransferase [Crocinitomicaceae bacterium]|nr:1-acyl-sn-glycerol-3-phosphate acyltransferase [Flavobacteriales bacterium]NQZ37005.1 1-acyl-sn-glycerol-3-phosphate acyltransferase [Crocinitomicaceae bacterium]